MCKIEPHDIFNNLSGKSTGRFVGEHMKNIMHKDQKRLID
jgi:hypothetical protein